MNEEKMKQYRWDNKKEILAHDILYTCTTTCDYSMDRIIVLEKDNKLIFLEGGHCSCYDFDETKWEATEFDRYDSESIIKFLQVDDDFDSGYLRKRTLEFLKYYSSMFRKEV